MLRKALRGLPDFTGQPIDVRFAGSLRVAGGKLVKQGGTEVHAATFLRERRMILDRTMQSTPRELRRIVAHEVFHFVWRRLGNETRNEWNELLRREFQAHAKGEMGWSAEWRKDRLQEHDATARTRKWREYACESFCDSAASLFVRDHPEISLRSQFRMRREQWLTRLMKQAPLPV